MNSDDTFSIALIIASAGRFSNLMYRIPIWASAGFDEVIIVGKYDESESKELSKLCSSLDVSYVHFPSTWKDMRSKQRNTGARNASTEWILFHDDDDAIIAEIDKEVLAKQVKGKDWLVGKKGEHILLHKRESFLKIKGYPEDMVLAEDMIMSNRARLYGKGGYEGNICKKVVIPPFSTEADFRTRIKNNFWYGFTFPIYFFSAQQPKSAFIGEIRRLLNISIKVFRNPKMTLLVAARILGYIFSPLHLIPILCYSGIKGFKRESYGDWQGLR